jgi:DNA invertase Pin-like site-specific DNA recombinase
MKQQIEYGYARKTTKDKDAMAQLRALQEAGISPKNIFVDQPAEREKFKQLMDGIRPKDVLVIKSLGQLGYDFREIFDEWTTFANVLGAHVRVLDIELLDTSAKRDHMPDSFVSDLFLQIASFAAQRERENIKHRQAEGIANAKSQGRHLGRPRIPKPEKFDTIYDQWRAGGVTAEEAMAQMSLKRSTFERFVKERKEELKKELEEKAS